MQKILATLAIMILAACGSAAQTGPKTSNPPLAKEPAPKTDDAQKPPMERDGLTLKFTHLAFQITMTPSPWKGNYTEDPNNGAQIAFERDDLSSVLLIMPVAAKNLSAQGLADDQHQKAMKDASLTVGAVTAENGGRYAFTIDRMADGVAHRTYLAVTPHPSLPDAYIVGVAEGTTSTSDAFLKEVRTVLDSISPIK